MNELHKAKNKRFAIKARPHLLHSFLRPEMTRRQTYQPMTWQQ